MANLRTLIAAVAATDAVKRTFTLGNEQFKNGSTPALRSTGCGVGDDIILWVWVAAGWVSLGSVLDEVTETYAISTMGEYAVTTTMGTVGPVSCELHCYKAS
jgi:hypothetical protein